MHVRPHGRCLIIGSLPRKVSAGRQFTGKNSPRPAPARAGQIFTDKLSAGGDLSGDDLIIGKLYEAGDIFISGDILIP